MTKDTFRKWNIYTSIHLFEYCFYSWRNLMFPHIHGYTDEKILRDLFWYYINYGNANTYYE